VSVSVRIIRAGRVDCRATLEVPLAASKVWGQLRDFRRFARQDFFHAEIEIDGRPDGVPRAGSTLHLTHRFFLFRVRRVGRICRWAEGSGFAFSDLSPRGPRRGFPHTFSYRLEPLTDDACRLHVRVSGLWTARWLPRPLAWLWLRWVMQFILQRVEAELLTYRLWLKRQKVP
jgi:hypothetical protein